ncbi:MAG: hypothetical protein R3A10_16625 [Caldilineaceae bacterium]
MGQRLRLGLQGNGPVLTLVHGAPPPTPPPLPTVPVIVATLTKVPENVLTVVAEAATATTARTGRHQQTPLPYAVVTPTPLPQNLCSPCKPECWDRNCRPWCWTRPLRQCGRGHGFNALCHGWSPRPPARSHRCPPRLCDAGAVRPSPPAQNAPRKQPGWPKRHRRR